MKNQNNRRIVVITGASSGIGEGLKFLFKENGDLVFNLSKSITEEDEFNIKCDITSESDVKSSINLIGTKYNRIDILINCAGFGVFGAVELTPLENVKKMFDVNLFGTMAVTQQALNYMSANSKIINISSACALFSVPFRSLYCASKSALNMMSYGLYMELKKSKIQVTSICPGDIKTNFSKNRNITPQTNQRYGDRIEKSINSISMRENKRMDRDVACKIIYRIINKKHLKPMYIVSKLYNFLYFAKRFSSEKTLLKLTNKMF